MSHQLRSTNKPNSEDRQLEERKTPLKTKETADYMLS
jgi:hypothetical protein